MTKGVVIGALLLLFGVSKEIIVFNAETVVFMSTVLTFGLLVKYAGGLFVNMLDEEANKIEEAFEQSRKLEIEIVKELKEYHQNQGKLSVEFESLQKVLMKQIELYLESRKVSMEEEWKGLVEQKLQRLGSLEQLAMDAFQETFVKVFTEKAMSEDWGDITDAQLAEMEVLLGEGKFSSWEVSYIPSKDSLKEFDLEAKLIMDPVKYEFLGKVEDLNPSVLNDPNYQVEFYYDDDFYL